MLTVLGNPRHCCDGLTRRELLEAGALSLFGTTLLPRAAPATSSGHPASKARSVILVDLFGGPSHLDMFDLKPEAPSAIRGEFKPIATTLPGLQICEHLPLLARWMHRTALIRTLSHGYNSHNPYAVMTGYTGGNDREDYFAKPSNHPSMGSVCQYLGVGRRQGLPGYIVLPAYPGYSQALRRAGPYGGYLGGQYNPVFSTCNPTFPRPLSPGKDDYDPTLVPTGDPGLPLPQDITLDALDRRRTLLEQVDQAASQLASSSMQLMTQRQKQAFELLLSPSSQRAFDLGKEPPAVRDRYGRDLLGSSMLLARRLVEAGVTFITVHTESRGTGHWDTHENNFNMLRQWLLPWLDRTVSALLDDLAQRGLLESTLVMVTGDMGRSPRINGKAGRDHWPQCGFCLLAGAGVKQGLAYGMSDRQGAFPLDHPVTPGDLVSTVYHLLGIDPETTVPDQIGRPIAISQGGKPIPGVLA